MKLADLAGLVPDANVRALLALIFTSVTGFLFATAQVVPNELLVLTTFIVKDYFAARQKAEDAPLPVFIPGDK